MKPVLFLDVDGVLNKFGEASNNSLDGSKIAILQEEVLSKVDCLVVLASTWRRYPRLVERLRVGGIPIHDLTPVVRSWMPTRGMEIKAWLDDHPEVKTFVILDDDIDGVGPELAPHLVATDSFTGLNRRVARRVRDKLTIG